MRAQRAATEKSIGYVNLIEACEQPGCPVCRRVDAEARRAVDTLLSEHVTDPYTRRRLRASWGLCNWHTSMVLETDGVATGASILYEDLLGACGARVEHLRDDPADAFVRVARRFKRVADELRRRRIPRLVRAYRSRARCPLCTRRRVSEVSYVTTVVDSMMDPQFSRAYEASAGLCVQHLISAVEAKPGAEGLARLLDASLAKWERLRRDLDRLVSKHEYRSTDVVTPDEATSYRRASETLAGRPGVFGNDLHRDTGA